MHCRQRSIFLLLEMIGMAQLLMKKLKEHAVVLLEISIDLDDEESDQLHNILDIVVPTENSELEWIAKYIECRRFIRSCKLN